MNELPDWVITGAKIFAIGAVVVLLGRVMRGLEP